MKPTQSEATRLLCLYVRRMSNCGKTAKGLANAILDSMDARPENLFMSSQELYQLQQEMIQAIQKLERSHA